MRGEREFLDGFFQARKTRRQKKRNGKEKERVKAAKLSGTHQSMMRCSIHQRKSRKKRKWN